MIRNILFDSEMLRLETHVVVGHGTLVVLKHQSEDVRFGTNFQENMNWFARLGGEFWINYYHQGTFNVRRNLCQTGVFAFAALRKAAAMAGNRTCVLGLRATMP